MKTLVRFIAALALLAQLKAADLTVSANVHTFLSAADFAAMRTSLDVPSLSGDNVFTGTNTFGPLSMPLTLDGGAAPTVDGFGELSGDNNAWAASRGALKFFDGSAATNLIGVLTSDAPSNGQVPQFNTDGTITWETPGSGSVATDAIFDAAGDMVVGTGANTAARVAISPRHGARWVSNSATAGWRSQRDGSTLFEDFLIFTAAGIGSYGWAADSNAGGTLTHAGAAANPGQAVLNISTTGSSREGLWAGVDVASISFGSGEFYWETLAKVSALSDATDTYILRVGCIDTRGELDSVDGVYFRYTHGVNSGNWEGITRSNSVETIASGGTAAPPSTTFQKLGILVNAAGTLVTFYVDDVSMGTSATNIPTAAGRETGIGGAFITRTAGTTTARSFTLDYIYVDYKLTTPR